MINLPIWESHDSVNEKKKFYVLHYVIAGSEDPDYSKSSPVDVYDSEDKLRKAADKLNKEYNQSKDRNKKGSNELPYGFKMEVTDTKPTLPE